MSGKRPFDSWRTWSKCFSEPPSWRQSTIKPPTSVDETESPVLVITLLTSHFARHVTVDGTRNSQLYRPFPRYLLPHASTRRRLTYFKNTDLRKTCENFRGYPRASSASSSSLRWQYESLTLENFSGTIIRFRSFCYRHLNIHRLLWLWSKWRVGSLSFSVSRTIPRWFDTESL